MNPILYLLYHFFKLLVLIFLRAFYPLTAILHREHLRFRGPAIVISNHPNTLLDALHVAARVREPVFFLANASLFRGWFQNWLLSTLYCIPVERPKDTGGRRVSNEENFARCYQHLEGAGNIWIAPEGGSEMERRLRPFRTGTARIALGAEKHNNYQLGLRIVPVGLTYEAPDRFGSRVVLQAGEAVWVRDFREQYENHPTLAVKQLTALLEERTRALLVHTRDEQEDELLEHLETVLRNDAPLSTAEHFHRTRGLLQQLRRWREDRPEGFQRQQEAVQQYFTQLADHGLDDQAVQDRGPGLPALLAGAPLFLYGLIHNALPALVPHQLARRLGLYIGYHSTVKVMAGLLSFPLFYWLQGKLVASFFGAPWAWLYLLSLPPAGFFAWWYAGKLKQLWRRRRLARYPDLRHKLRTQRAAIQRWLAALRGENEA